MGRVRLPVNYIIYKTTNKLNGLIYVGQDKYNRSLYLGSGVKLREALKKYGKENFQKEILQVCGDVDQKIVDKAERFWIRLLKCRNPKVGYNLAAGGVDRRGRSRLPGTYKHSDLSLKKIRQGASRRKGKPAWNRGRNDYLTEQSLIKMRAPKSEAHKSKLRGKKRSEESIERWKESRSKTKTVAYNRRSVVQYNKDGSLIRAWDSISKASQALGLRTSDISRCCRGIGKSCGGFIWKYLNI